MNHPLSQINNQQKPPPNKVDRLSGMMTDKEKNWVVSVQMLQLQNDDPYSYDFYYTVCILMRKCFDINVIFIIYYIILLVLDAQEKEQN